MQWSVFIINKVSKNSQKDFFEFSELLYCYRIMFIYISHEKLLVITLIFVISPTTHINQYTDSSWQDHFYCVINYTDFSLKTTQFSLVFVVDGNKWHHFTKSSFIKTFSNCLSFPYFGSNYIAHIPKKKTISALTYFYIRILLSKYYGTLI